MTCGTAGTGHPAPLEASQAAGVLCSPEDDSEPEGHWDYDSPGEAEDEAYERWLMEDGEKGHTTPLLQPRPNLKNRN